MSFIAICLCCILCGVLLTVILYTKKNRKIRKDAIKRSRAVLGGLAGEQIAPYLPGFPCNPAEVRFVGKPVDYIGFEGAASGEEIKEILFIEVKTGQSQLSERERQIKNAVESGRVRYVEYRL
ncbi:MAG: Holliday junction resolvase [Treponema sp.]|nr:Holliday junction resolvase [Treponema sp.]